MEVYMYNERVIYLMQVTDVFHGYQFETHMSVSDEPLKHQLLVEEAIKFNTKVNVIIYHQSSQYLHAFDKGLVYRYIMEFHYTSDDVQHVVNKFFSEELPLALTGKLIPEYASIFVKSLKASMLEVRDDVQKLISNEDLRALQQDYANLRNDTEETLKKIYQRVKNMSCQQLAQICAVIATNKINMTTSSNIFNLIQSEPNQQNALNIKKVTARNNVDSDIDDDTIHEYDVDSCNRDELFRVGHYYIQTCPLTTIYMVTDVKGFHNLIAKNYVYCFKILSSHTNTLRVLISVRQDLLESFGNIRIDNNIIQYEITNEQPTDIRYYSSMRENVWQSGDDYLFMFNNFSNETMKEFSRRYRIYGIFSRHAIDTLVRLAGATFKIVHCVQNNDFLFYYTHLYINRRYDYLLTTTVCDLAETRYIEPKENFTMNEIYWCDRPHLHMFYQTYFKFHTKITNVDQDVLDAMKTNLINFKYLERTGNLDLSVQTPSEANTMFDVTMQVIRNMKRDTKETKFSHFDALVDGPLVAAVSIRTCEKTTNPIVLNKHYPIDTTNVSALVNIPNYIGSQNPDNAINI